MEENKTGKNVSSGAKKVEKIEEKAPRSKTAASKNSGGKKTSKPSAAAKNAKVEKAEKAEKAQAQKRLNQAKAKAEKKEKKLLKKAELKQKKLEKKAQLKEKRLAKSAALKEKQAERKQKRMELASQAKARKTEKRAERAARREMLKNESKADRAARRSREKKDRVALKRQRQESRDKAREQKMKSREASRSRRAQEKRHKREQNTERRKHAPGFGGWLAAVISLGVACLALGTVVTAGAFRMNDMQLETANGYRSTLYDLVSVSESMDTSLGKLRVSSGAAEQRTLLTDLLVDSELMESAIERMPIDSMTGTDISAFVNKTGTYCRNLLQKLAKGEPLSSEEKQTVETLYNTNARLYNELNDMTTHMAEKDFMAFIGGKGGTVSDRIGKAAQSTLEQPEETEKAPFSDEGNVGENMLSGLEEVSEREAEKLAGEYLQNFTIKETQFTGETISKNAELYNFTLKDEDGTEIFAQITKRGGKLAFFDAYEICEDKNFDLETCDSLAREFLSDLGIEDVEAVWLSDSGMVADLTYAAVQNGVRIYPDLIRVRVCESRGRVVGMEAMEYLLNHREREISGSMAREEAQEKLDPNLTPYSARLALIPLNGEEVLAHEFACTYGEDEYVVYLDGQSGEEVKVYRVRNSARGSYLE